MAIIHVRENMRNTTNMNVNKDVMQSLKFDEILHEVVQQSTVLKKCINSIYK